MVFIYTAIRPGQTTFDGRFTLLPTCCLGNCDKGPTMMIDDDTHSYLADWIPWKPVIWHTTLSQ
jgi:NADH:ubiquinone oxidoreductase subunit E